MDIGSVLSQLRGVAGALPTMQFGGTPAAPAVPADGTMQPTIGPGAAAPIAPATLKTGMPAGGLLAMMQGRTNPQGLVGLLQQLSANRQAPAAPMTAPPAGAGMLSPSLPPQPSQIGSLPLDIKPMDLF